MYPLRYHRPATLAGAAALFNPEARYISGGQTLLPTMKQRLAAPSDLIDIGRLPELMGIAVTGDRIVIGAAVTHAAVAASPDVAAAMPALAALAGSIGDPAVRAMGTIGGSVANNDPAADYPAAVLAAAAVICTNVRAIPADDYFRGLFATALEDGEIVTAVEFPVARRAAYQKFRNPASRYALVGVFVAELADGSIRVTVTGAGGRGVFRAKEIEDALAKSWSPAAVDSVAIDPSGLISDIHATAAYRASLIRVMAKRAAAAIA
jgi:carbon-monoxide dehydrogenase medium subunit